MKALRAYRKPSDLPLHRLLKGTAGRVLMSVRPEFSSAIKASPFSSPLPLSGRLIRNGHFLNAIGAEDHAMIRDFLKDYWSSQASDEFYTGLCHRYETLFLAYHEAIVGETVRVLRESGCHFRQMVEIGSGDGKILEHFSRFLPEVSFYHGVDLNLPQIENNRLVYADKPQLEFHHCDGNQWLNENAVPGTILMTNGGVLEYFTRKELEAIFSRLSSQHSPCMIVLTESIAADHDLEFETKTYPYGWELSLSHNYLALLREAGFTIEYVHDRYTTPEEADTVGRWLQVVAISRGGGR